MKVWRATAVVLLGLALIAARPGAKAEEAHAGRETADVGGAADAKSRAKSDHLVPPFSGIELDKWSVDGDEVVAPAPGGRLAHLALDPALQRATERVLRNYKPFEAAAVVLETQSGRVRVWASHVEHGKARDLCVEAVAPAASIFKIVTGAALVETAGLTPDLRQCYSGGESRITELDLVDDPRRDHACATLGEAMGRSLNTVFARLAKKHLSEADLGGMATILGFGTPIPFDLEVAPSEAHFPKDPLGFARTAAGFWNTTLSPIQAANLAATVANGGEIVRPVLVESVTDRSGPVYHAPERVVVRRAIRAETAAALSSMMENTVTLGTSARAFRDNRGRAFLPNIGVAGKTGTLSSPDGKQLYTWFVGFAPIKAPEVALGVLVDNEPNWRAKANVVARDILRAYFAEKGAPGVSRP